MATIANPDRLTRATANEILAMITEYGQAVRAANRAVDNACGIVAAVDAETAALEAVIRRVYAATDLTVPAGDR